MRAFAKWKEESSSHSINNNMLLIGMSANASTEDQNEAFEAGMHFFASKPVDVIALSLLLDNKKSCQDLNETIDVLRTVAMSSEDTGDVYCSQRCNLRSPPHSCFRKSTQDCSTQSTTPEMNTTSSSRLELYAQETNRNHAVPSTFSVPMHSESCISSAYACSNIPSASRSRSHSRSLFSTVRRYWCWKKPSRIRNR